jgi:DNA-binding response OmpR family regulator
MVKILLLEDDTVLADILVDYLQENYEVQHTYSKNEALKLCEENRYDMYLFDINVPDGNGIKLLEELRSFSDKTPTIFITAFHDTKHLKSAFESGANDFIRKPFDLEELGVRIENIKKHFGIDVKIMLTPEIAYDTQTHTIQNGVASKTLRAKESACLEYLYRNRHRVVSAEELLQNIWDYEEMPTDNAIRTIVKELRKILGHEHILNVRGEGYKFE